MESNEIEIFGTNVSQTKRVHHGFHISVNVKNHNAYISRELSKELFGSSSSGRINIIHSKIENNWYVASTAGSLFNGGFECVQNDAGKESVFRINGASSVFRQMVASLVGGPVESKRYTLDVSRNVKEYDGMKLHQITLLQQ